MIRKFVLPLIATGLLVFAAIYVLQSGKNPPPNPPPVEPPRGPYPELVAGAGMVEAKTENISIGSALPGVIDEVMVVVGQAVDAKAPLFRLDDRMYQSEVRVAEADLVAAQAELNRLESMPRPEEIPASEARVLEAQANLVEREDQLRKSEPLYQRRAITESELVTRQQAVEVAKQQLATAQANHRLLLKGAWEADKAVARARVAQANAAVTRSRNQLDRITVRAPVPGEVLQVNVRPGEFVAAPASQALVVLGNVRTLNVRVDIDEDDISRFQIDAPAQAALRSDPQKRFDLKFQRVEPYVIPKRSLTGDNTERVDTRVLQVIYALEPNTHKRLYVGQQLDVFIAAAHGDKQQVEQASAKPIEGQVEPASATGTVRNDAVREKKL